MQKKTNRQMIFVKSILKNRFKNLFIKLKKEMKNKE